METTGTGHVGNGWEIVTTLPTNITSQQANYQWPATFSSSTGNFALINSDGEGETGVQDAYFEYTGVINLSPLGNASLNLQFNEYYRNFYEQTFVEVSNDNGVTWTTFEANPESEVPVNTNCVDGEMEVINITAAKGAGPWTNQVKIRFHYVGQYDWYWGIDNVEIVESWNNDLKVTSWYQSTPVATSFGLDYYYVPASQVSFPGITFGAKATNMGALDQSTAFLSATATGGYAEDGTSIAIASLASDSLEIATPYLPTGLGTKSVSLTSTIGAADSDNTNNVHEFDMYLTQYEFSRDNNIQSGVISQISSQNDVALKIGNVMEIFDDMDVTAVKLYLGTQATGAIGGEYFAELYKYNGTDAYEWLAQTEIKSITSTTAGWSQLLIDNGPISLQDGDDILVVAGHYGGVNEVRFGLAQNTFEQSVLGFNADNELFALTSPGAVMIRLLDDPTASLEENTVAHSLNLFPNPANASATVAFELDNAAVVSLNVTDITGKEVASQSINAVAGANQATIDATKLSSGVYFVNLTAYGVVSTQKLIVRK